MWKLLLSLLILFCSVCAHAQHLKRKGSLGVSLYQQVPDSLAQKLGYKEGAMVKMVALHSTAFGLGLQENDIITGINGRSIVNTAALVQATKGLRENERIEVSLLRNSKPRKLGGTVVAKPKETSTTADVVYGEFAYKGGYVRTIYKSPMGRRPLGTVYFLQGLPCYSMDNFKDLDITKQAIDAMVERGFAVYRMEKGDMGDNMDTPPCETLGFDEELEMHKAGYAHLLKLTDVDTNRIFLFGHSMGGVTAPLLAEQFHPKGVVVYGTVFKPWMDYLFDAYVLQSLYYGEDLAQLREQLEIMKPYAYDYFYHNRPIEDICRTPTGRIAMETLLSYDTATKLAASGRSPLCHKELNGHNLARAWKNTEGHVLAVYGECDIAAIHPDDHTALIDHVNRSHPGKGTFWLAPRTTHTFEEIGTMDEFIKWQARPNEYAAYAASRFNSKVFDHVCDWMKDVLRK